MTASTSRLLLALAFLSSVASAESSAANPPEREVVILHIADTHAALDVHPEVFFDDAGEQRFEPAGGYALLASAIDKERAALRGKDFMHVIELSGRALREPPEMGH